MSIVLPSIYWPMSQWGFSRRRRLRRLFHRLICQFYRKRIWNPLINSWAKNRGFDQRRYIRSNNGHAIGSVTLLPGVAFFLYAAQRSEVAMRSLPPGSDGAHAMADAQRSCYRWMIASGLLELGFNAPAIILSRYLYLLTKRRPSLQRACLLLSASKSHT